MAVRGDYDSKPVAEGWVYMDENGSSTVIEKFLTKSLYKGLGFTYNSLSLLLTRQLLPSR
jgi:hypothetical protein